MIFNVVPCEILGACGPHVQLLFQDDDWGNVKLKDVSCNTCTQ